MKQPKIKEIVLERIGGTTIVIVDGFELPMVQSVVIDPMGVSGNQIPKVHITQLIMPDKLIIKDPELEIETRKVTDD